MNGNLYSFDAIDQAKRCFSLLTRERVLNIEVMLRACCVGALCTIITPYAPAYCTITIPYAPSIPKPGCLDLSVRVRVGLRVARRPMSSYVCTCVCVLVKVTM